MRKMNILKSGQENRLLETLSDRKTSQVKIGEMFLFSYDPKHKKTLPHYDKFPLIFPFEVADGGFLGLNVHYLPLKLRAQLMDGLYTLASDSNFDENTKLNLRYQSLKGVAKMKYFRPCVKRYLVQHMKSPPHKIHSSEWDIALFLPLARFEKESTQTVWAKARKAVR